MAVILKKFQIDKYLVPVLIINLKKQSIISLPTQLGCPVMCTFCVSRDNKFLENLSDTQMMSLINNALVHVTAPSHVISFTGEGEAYMNAKNIQSVINHFSDDDRLDYFRVCTSGIKVSNMDAVQSSRKPLNFQFSMHSPFDEVRKTLIQKTRSLDEIIGAVRQQTVFDEVAVNYVLIDGFNDSVDDIAQFCEIVPKTWVVKLNPLIENPRHQLKRSPHTEMWGDILRENGYDVRIFNKIGSSLQNDYEDEMTYELLN